jgi:uncharacterized membrane protein YdfJ with MMPL/SSD domain
MLRRWNAVLAIAVLAMGSVALANSQNEKAASIPPSVKARAQEKQKKAAAEAEAKQLLLLMDTNKEGRVSKQEWMKFMGEEFDRLDTNHDGYVDVKDLMRSQLRAHRPYEVVGK